MSIALNVIATSLIAGRLLHRSKEVQTLGIADSDARRQYLSVLAVFVESGALYTISGVVFVPMYAINHRLSNIFAVLFAASASIAPMLILLRTSLGTAYSHSFRATHILGEKPLSTLVFEQRDDINETSKVHCLQAARQYKKVDRSGSWPYLQERTVSRPDDEVTVSFPPRRRRASSS